jgi:hypothetical protein
MVQHSTSDFHGRGRFSSLDEDPGDLRIPGVPRGSGLLAPLGALLGGGVSGVVVGVSAGPIGLRIGAAVGALISLVGYLALRSRTARDDAYPLPARASRVAVVRRTRPRPVLRFFLRTLGCISGVLGLAAAAMTGLLMNDERATETTILWACTFSVGLLLMAAAILWPAPGAPNVEPPMVLRRRR